jgi:hypothetical protein
MVRYQSRPNATSASRSACDRGAPWRCSSACSTPRRSAVNPDDVAAAIVAMATNGYVTGSVLDCAGGAQLATGP